MTRLLPLTHLGQHLAEQAQFLAVLGPVAGALRLDSAVVMAAGLGREARQRVGASWRGGLRDSGPCVRTSGTGGLPTRQLDVGLLARGAGAEQTGQPCF